MAYGVRVRARGLGDTPTLDPSVLAQVAAIYAFYMGNTFLSQQFATGVIPYAQAVTAGQMSLNDVERDLANFYVTNAVPGTALVPTPIAQRIIALYQRLTHENNVVGWGLTNNFAQGAANTAPNGNGARILMAYTTQKEGANGAPSDYVPLTVPSDVQAIVNAAVPASAAATTTTGGLSDVPSWLWLVIAGGGLYALSR